MVGPVVRARMVAGDGDGPRGGRVGWGARAADVGKARAADIGKAGIEERCDVMKHHVGEKR